ncbi:hypothetical protein GQ55_9G626600 [Panicum hallii var. hallii]|uniref:Uncharacterized protein n=1 Tax=Panicum hallii var. hallii TaxID=1504633 RepID=A0A2T7CI34_9POAL|nr:hypothetical protein GQ55_9G626600 [Panicum hallii var. hallii]
MLLSWAQEAHLSMGGLGVKHLRVALPVLRLSVSLPAPRREPRTPSSISGIRPQQLDCFDGEHPRTLLYLP